MYWIGWIDRDGKADDVMLLRLYLVYFVHGVWSFFFGDYLDFFNGGEYLLEYF
jgi:hypothetical protein